MLPKSIKSPKPVKVISRIGDDAEEIFGMKVREKHPKREPDFWTPKTENFDPAAFWLLRGEWICSLGHLKEDDGTTYGDIFYLQECARTGLLMWSDQDLNSTGYVGHYSWTYINLPGAQECYARWKATYELEDAIKKVGND